MGTTLSPPRAVRYIVRMKKEITAHSFPEVYERLGIKLDDLGCIMLDLHPFENNHLAKKVVEEALYTAKDKKRFWINGWSFDEPHITLLYGLLKPGLEMKQSVDDVLDGWPMPEVFVSHVGYFDSKVEDEDYYCLVAHIALTPELLEGHARLQLLPHVDTFLQYRPHATIAYIKREKGDTYRDEIIGHFNSLFAGKRMRVKEINYGGNKG